MSPWKFLRSAWSDGGKVSFRCRIGGFTTFALPFATAQNRGAAPLQSLTETEVRGYQPRRRFNPPCTVFFGVAPSVRFCFQTTTATANTRRLLRYFGKQRSTVAVTSDNQRFLSASELVTTMVNILR